MYVSSRTMFLPARPALLVVAAALACCVDPLIRPAASAVTVETTKGRQYSGVVDSATDEARLVLRVDGSQCYARRFLSWDGLARAWEEGQELSIAELKARAAALATPPQIVQQPPALADGRAAGQSTEAPAPPTPASIAVDAVAANWNRDVLPDGLLLDLAVHDASGRPIPAAGTLTIELVGFRHGLEGGSRRFPLLGRWVQTVEPSDFGPAGARYRLPFLALHPEEALDLSAIGMVHAVLAVPGAGTFEAADNLVTLRRFAPLREELFEEQGTRYFSFEGTGRGRRFGP